MGPGQHRTGASGATGAARLRRDRRAAGSYTTSAILATDHKAAHT
jgi:hypothetical protein